jgi:hypothetical protein
MGEKRNAYRLLVQNPEGKRPLGRPRRNYVENIKMDLGEIGWGGVKWIGLAQNKCTVLVNEIMNTGVPLGNYSGYKTGCFSNGVQLHRVG